MISRITDDNEKLSEQALELFPRLSESILREERDPARTANRLRHLPESIVYYTFRAVRDDEKERLDPLIHRLRTDAERLIQERLDRSELKSRLEGLIERARSQLTFRNWRLEDLPRFIALLDNEKLWRLLPEDYPDPVTEELARRLIEISGDLPDRHVVRAVEWRGEPIGQVRLQFDSSPYPDSAEISYWTGEPFWGKGWTAATVARFTRESFEQYPGIERIFAQVLEGNEPSLRVLEKAGYHRESFRHRNVTKRGNQVFSTHVFAVHRGEYLS